MKTLRLFSGLLLLGLSGFSAEPAAPSAVADIDYRITAGDTIQFQMYNQLDMTTVQRVTANGEVRLPLVGTVRLAQLTLRDAEHLLEKVYRDEGYFVEPQVILAVQQYGDRFVAVLGQVKDPARIALAPETNTIGILQAITQAGGFTRVARTEAVQVLRGGQAATQAERVTVNLEEILHPKNGTPAPEFQLRAGDIVFVPERPF